LEVWPTIQTMFYGAAISTGLQTAAKYWFRSYAKKAERQEQVPEEFGIFKAALEEKLEGTNQLVNRRFDELDRRLDEQASSILENRRDYVGLRTDVGRIAGQINFKLWRRETDPKGG